MNKKRRTMMKIETTSRYHEKKESYINDACRVMVELRDKITTLSNKQCQ
jgi:hypothetical protein